MQVHVVAVGKVKGLAPSVREYERRAGRYWRLEVHEVPQSRGAASKEVCRAEASAIRARMRPGFVDVALTREGEALSSRDLAAWLGSLALHAATGVQFIIGGAFGLEPELKETCERRVSLSSMTLPHDFARLILAEQLYRAGTILRNEPYHKGPK